MFLFIYYLYKLNYTTVLLATETQVTTVLYEELRASTYYFQESYAYT